MKAQELREIAHRLLRMADEMEGITTDRGAVKVTLPGPSFPDLFSQMGLTDESTPMEQAENLRVREADEQKDAAEDAGLIPRKYARVGCKMQDDVIVAADAMKVGRATGYCQRSDIERSLLRKNPDASREAIREAVNEAVAQLGLLCITHNSYRYYRSVDRGRIIEIASAKLSELSEDLKKKIAL